MVRARPVAGGGRAIEVAPGRVIPWLGRFAAAHGGLATLTTELPGVTALASDGATATLAAPFPPMAVAGLEPVEALLAHIAQLGLTGVILVRAGAYSVGVAEGAAVTASSTDRRLINGRTAAGGWSQQRYARRRGNQRRETARAAANAAFRLLAADAGIGLLVMGGEEQLFAEVLLDPRLKRLTQLRRRVFRDIPEPRRAVLDAVAARAVSVDITVRDGLA